jgi:hypothetical protein
MRAADKIEIDDMQATKGSPTSDNSDRVWEMKSVPQKATPAQPYTPRTLAFNTLDRQLPLREQNEVWYAWEFTWEEFGSGYQCGHGSGRWLVWLWYILWFNLLDHLGSGSSLFIYFYDIKIRNSMIEQFSNENGSRPIEGKM